MGAKPTATPIARPATPGAAPDLGHRAGHAAAGREEPPKGDGPSENIRPLLSAEQVAEILGITVSGLMFHCRAGRIPMVKVGRLNRFQPADVEAYIASSRVQRG